MTGDPLEKALERLVNALVDKVIEEINKPERKIIDAEVIDDGNDGRTDKKIERLPEST